ncbi:MAG: hypothetical protein ACOCPM_06375 [Bacteroidales bacterium]
MTAAITREQWNWLKWLQKKAGDSPERIKTNDIWKLASNKYLREKDTTETEPMIKSLIVNY